MSEPIQTVLLGLGNMGKNHLRVLEKDKRFKVVALVEPRTADLSDELLQRYKIFKNFDELNDLNFEAAVVATPTETHFQVVNYLLRARKHVLVEKPTASTLAETTELVALASDFKLKFCVGHIERFNPAVRKLEEILQSGIIGRPLFASAYRAGGFPRHVQPGNDVILDLGIHEIDVLNRLCGPLRILGGMARCLKFPKIPDVADAWVEGREGFRATIHVDWYTPSRIRTLQVVGELGTVSIDYRNQTVSLDGEAPLKITMEEPLQRQLDGFFRLLNGLEHGLCTGDEMARTVGLATEWARIAGQTL